MNLFSDILKMLSDGDKSIILIFLSILSCFCPVFVYFYVAQYTLFVSLETIKLILLVLSTGLLTFSAFFLVEFLAYGLRLSLKSIDPESLKTILITPVIYNTSLYSILIFRHIVSLVECLIIMVVFVCINIIFNVLEGIIMRKKLVKKQKELELKKDVK